MMKTWTVVMFLIGLIGAVALLALRDEHVITPDRNGTTVVAQFNPPVNTTIRYEDCEPYYRNAKMFNIPRPENPSLDTQNHMYTSLRIMRAYAEMYLACMERSR